MIWPKYLINWMEETILFNLGVRNNLFGKIDAQITRLKRAFLNAIRLTNRKSLRSSHSPNWRLQSSESNFAVRLYISTNQ